MTAILPTLSTQYDPTTTESKWQDAWEKHQVFKADPNQEGEPYCIVIPPPNVTGSLHIGHAFEQALIDTLVRYHRMCGRNTLCLPGTDHASIAVSTIIDKQLKAEGKTRQELGREEYLRRAWAWKAESGGTIVNQLRRLGVSVDWSRERFTLDAGLSAAVLEAFIRLYKEGLIYRGNYLVNWCPATQSAVSDLEVENQEVDGSLWYFRYPLSDGSGHLEVATTRPETMLGDTAVAVNPQDDRYRHLIGKTVTLPIQERQIPIIGDELVDPAFGTGCVKVTPAHDPNDFEMGKRHQLPMINILNKDGTLNENGGPFVGLDRFVARKQVIERLEAEGFLSKIEAYRHTVPYSDRGKVPVEPLISTQWFVKINPLSEHALTCLDQQHSPHFVPERWQKVYRDWLANLKDWCISRQLWWGHQIPAWYAVSQTDGQITDYTPFVVARSEAEAQEKAIAQFGPDVELVQDPDVLDTWFSSGLWPFSTLGWPEQTADLQRYYPTTTMVTGFDIIFFWVARMTMMGGHFTQEMPFKDVFIHGLVRDENNRKISKTINNGIDPLILIDRYGTDALRYTLIREVAGAGQDIRLEYNRKTDESASVEASRNFANKLWNASRFVMMNLDGKTPSQLGQPQFADLELADRWILSRFQQLVQQTHAQVQTYGLGEAAKGLYDFIWGDFCDWYIELVKPRLRDKSSLSRQVAQQTLAYVLEGTLKLLHPFMPHITEELWQTLTQSEEGQFLASQAYPTLTDWQLTAMKPELINNASNVSSFPTELPSRGSPNIGTVVQSPPAGTQTQSPPWASPQTWPQGSQLWQHFSQQLPEQLRILFPKLQTSYQNYRQWIPLGLVILGALVVLRMVSAIASVIDGIPLLAPLYELVGFGYSCWFIYRYLLWSSGRSDLSTRAKSWLFQVFGELPPEPVELSTNPFAHSPPSTLHPNPVLNPLEEQPQAPTAEAVPLTSVPEPSTPESSTPELTAISLINPELEQQFELVISTIRTLRNLRAEADIKSGTLIQAILQSESDRERQILTAGQSYIKDLAKVESLTITPQLETEPQQTIVGVVGTVQVLVPLAGVVDVAALKAKIQKDLSKIEAEIETYTQRLSKPSFVEKAKPEVVQGARDALANAQKQAEILRDRLSRL
jgi:valyl-tRNA synthetase